MSGEEQQPYFGSSNHKLFHQVMDLSHPNHQQPWDELKKKMPMLPRGWFELARLSPEDRIEFTRAFWLAKLPYSSKRIVDEIENFFDEIDVIEIYATQLEPDQPFEIHMIYALKQEAGYFQGAPPATDDRIDILKQQFGHLNLPADYLAFLQIHNGFSKYTDTGLIKIQEIPRIYQHFQELLNQEELVRPDGQLIEPSHLIPFYESFGLHCYQCFYSDWYVENEMGNVYFSEYARTISNFLDLNKLDENLAFPTFLEWLVFYLEDIWHV